MAISWSDDLKVGSIEIDADHKELIGIVNDFADKANSPDGVSQRTLRITLERLQIYTHDHFAREEYIQAISKYAGLAENKRQHDALRKTLADYISKFDRDDIGDVKAAADEISAFLNHWLMTHIVEIDLKMRGAITNESWR
jgi:hemerythrin